jgi:peroxin-11B
VRLTPPTVGRDKVLRTLQYFSRFLAWYLYRTNHPTSTIAPFSTTKAQFGLTRKLMRVGKFIEHFKAAAVASDAKAMDPVLRATAVGRQLGYAFYMLLDSACVLDAVGIRKFGAAARLGREAYRAWFAGISFSIVSGVYALYNLQAQQQAQLQQKLGPAGGAGGEEKGEEAVQAKKVAREMAAVKVQLVSDLCDITIPATALGWVALDDGIVGLAGTVSSLLGVWGQWKKTA